MLSMLQEPSKMNSEFAKVHISTFSSSYNFANAWTTMRITITYIDKMATYEKHRLTNIFFSNMFEKRGLI